MLGCHGYPGCRWIVIVLVEDFEWRALKIDEAVDGPDHPNVTPYVNNLGGALRDLGDHTGAKAERVLKIAGTVYGPDHQTTQAIRNDLESFSQHRLAPTD